ncbi:ThiF family adenylyltransferase [Mastigocoleus testarum]|uniref:Thiamine biosynthesis protein ThiF n=1 Tax=Mastigocoleus testarum BC008 TaxID=371196 RepID=A0A0V8A077_9CYAN|nr:ThiF family adenylyltransferase [Mastigocoleus testarum]KST66825.1 thiamine biosynthesis protein ThiF [Mastigocoleus testarum BC008]KST70162.1 thiamine biosynthesis protein ThiF [Mastigocoleus testarum BC008]
MTDAFFHEQLHRTPALMAKLRDFPIAICGAGALGANLTENLARSGFSKLRVIDKDRIEERNLSTQPYYRSDVGAYKAKILTNSLYRALGIAVDGRSQELTPSNVKQLLNGSALVVDCFDNSIARQIVTDYCATHIPCLHVGLASDYAEIIWNQIYRVPTPANDDVCDYPLARNLVILTVAVACEVITNFVASEQQKSFTVTLADFAIKAFDL